MLRMWEQIKMFYERDDVSGMTSDKKSTVTRRKIKMRVKVLNDHMKTLNLKFLSEHKTVFSVSYVRFRWLSQNNKTEKHVIAKYN